MKQPAVWRSPAEAGFALRLVLWMLVPVALLFAMLAAARSDAQVTANLRSAAELEVVADDAIHTAMFGLLRRGTPRRRRAGCLARRSGCRSWTSPGC